MIGVKMIKTICVVFLVILYISPSHSTVLVMDADSQSDIEVPTTPETVRQYTARNMDRNVQMAKEFGMKRYYSSRMFAVKTAVTSTTPSSEVYLSESSSISTTSINGINDRERLHTRYTHFTEEKPQISPILTETKDVSWTRLDVPGFSASTEKVQCPTDKCYCQLMTRIERYLIVCKYQKLGAIPSNFTVVDIVYYEITFSEGNNITNIPYYAFRNLRVERINLLKNNLQSIQSGAFVGLEPYLKELLLQGDRLMPVPYDKISNLGKLHLLQLRNFQQDTIEDNNYFDQFPNLEVLQFYQIYTLTTIHSLAFQNKLLNLTQLEFQYVYFKQIPVAALTHLNSLKKLYIKQTPISAIYSQSFEKMYNLIDLDISHNKIQMLEVDTFVGLEDQLVYLDLTSNELTDESLVALSSKTWTKLDQLSLSYNNELGDMQENVFQGMFMLQYLSLVEINMKEIKTNTFSGLNNLHTLDLSWNKIAVIHEGAFKFMPNLYELRLNSQFRTYGNNVIPLSIFMDFSPVSFQGIQYSLAVLNLEQTPFKPENLWETLTYFTKLEDLRLSETRIRQIPDFSFVHNKKLNTLELKQNQIDHISDNAFSGLEQSLESIYLDTNNLTTISHCAFKNFTGLKFLNLVENNLNCDCRLKWLHNFITERYRVVPYFFKEDFQCRKPVVMADKYLADVSIDSLTCYDNVTELCVEKEYTTVTTTQTATTVKAPVETLTTEPNLLALTVAGTTKYSISVAWRIADKTDIIGFRLVYYQTIEKLEQQILIHKDEFLYTIHSLQPGMFYAICITAETHSNPDTPIKDCRTTATESLNPHTNSQEGTLSNGTDNGGNIVIGAIIGSIALVIFVIVGLYQVVKYKLQKLKNMQLSLSQTQQVRRHTPQGNDGDDNICTIPNEYTDIETAMIANRFQGSSSRQLNRQFGFDNNPNEGYESIRRFHRELDVQQPEDCKSEIQLQVDEAGKKNAAKPELELRYSAPSRLNAVDLMRNDQALHRPLPVFPIAGTSCTALYKNQSK